MTGTDLAALHEAFDAGALAAFSAEYGDFEAAELSLQRAGAAADLAFPSGSREAAAFSVVLGTVRAAARTPACAGHPDPDLWFDNGREDEAKAVCGGCPVRARCLKDALDRKEPFGVWGGLDSGERRQLAYGDGPVECSGCGQVKPSGEFGSDGAGGRSARCLECAAAEKREYRRRRREKYAARAASRAEEDLSGRKEKTGDRC